MVKPSYRDRAFVWRMVMSPSVGIGLARSGTAAIIGFDEVPTFLVGVHTELARRPKHGRRLRSGPNVTTVPFEAVTVAPWKMIGVGRLRLRSRSRCTVLVVEFSAHGEALGDFPLEPDTPLPRPGAFVVVRCADRRGALERVGVRQAQRGRNLGDLRRGDFRQAGQWGVVQVDPDMQQLAVDGVALVPGVQRGAGETCR